MKIREIQNTNTMENEHPSWEATLNTLPELPFVVSGGRILGVTTNEDGRNIIVEAYNGHIGETGFHVLWITADNKGYYNGSYNIKTYHEALETSMGFSASVIRR